VKIPAWTPPARIQGRGVLAKHADSSPSQFSPSIGNLAEFQHFNKSRREPLKKSSCDAFKIKSPLIFILMVVV
jgi:hypothetical protein